MSTQRRSTCFISHKRVFGLCLLEFHNIKKMYLIYVPITQKMVSSHDVIFDKSFPSALSYTTHTHSEALAMRPEFLYIPYAT